MIRFCCEHCGNKVCVDDAHAGARGRCPNCRRIVAIPSPARPSINDNVATLAAALQGDRSDSKMFPPPPPPPPPKIHNTDTDEFDMVDIHASSAFETDTYPAIPDDGGKANGDLNHHAKKSTASPRDAKPLSYLALIVVALLAAAILAATVYLLRGCFT